MISCIQCHIDAFSYHVPEQHGASSMICHVRYSRDLNSSGALTSGGERLLHRRCTVVDVTNTENEHIAGDAQFPLQRRQQLAALQRQRGEVPRLHMRRMDDLSHDDCQRIFVRGQL